MAQENLASTPFKRSGNFLNRSARRLGGLVVSPPLLGRSRGGPEQPAIIKAFEGRLGVATGLMEADDPETLQDRVELTAHLMVSERMVDPQTEVEIRPLAPADDFWEQDQTGDYLAATAALTETLDDQYGIHAMHYSEPIAPTKHEDSPVDPSAVWQTVGSELSDLRKQMTATPGRKLAMLAIAERPYAQHILAGQIHFAEADLEDSPLVVMQRSGEVPRENLLLPAQMPRLLEAGAPESTRLL